MFKDIYKLAIGIMFIVTGIMAVVGLGKLANIGLEAVLGVENCEYRAFDPKIDGTRSTTEPVCKQDTNNTKRDAANSLSMVLVSLPASIFAYRKINNQTLKKKKR